MAHGKDVLTFRLSRVAHGDRNIMTGIEEQQLQVDAQTRREVLLPGVDVATAFAMQNVLGGACAQRLRNVYEVVRGQDCYLLDHADDSPDAEKFQAAFDTANAERGWAVFMPERWKHLHHVVRYFDLIEKNEAPDTSLLEWLVSAGVVGPPIAQQTAKRFKKAVPQGRHLFVLHPDDTMRLEIAAEARVQLEIEEAN